MGRIFLTFLLTLIPLHVYAEGIQPCSTWNSVENANATCNAQPGCKFNTDENSNNYNKCEACDLDHFGAGCEKVCSNANDGAGPDFPFAHIYEDAQHNYLRGARTKYECYKMLDDETGNGHGATCINREGNSVSCRQYYRDNNSANNNYVSQQNGSTYYYIVCEDTDHNSPDLIETVGYHGEDTRCIDLNNADSTLYQYYCAKAYSAPLNPTSSPTVMRYHIETGGKCYSNALTCGKFGATGGCTSANTNDISFSGYLRWNWNTKQWQQDINATAFTCKCTKNNIDIEVSGNDYTCTGDADYNASGTVYSPNTVEGTSVAYNDYPVGYSCESCKAGYVGFVRRAGNTQMKTCFPAMNGCFSSGCGTGYAYGCFDAPYNFDNNNGFRCLKVGDYSDLSFEDFYKPCYAGMTSAAGSDGPEDCHYTNDTNFCDAYGCVSMGQLLQNTGTSQGNWTWYMQQ